MNRNACELKVLSTLPPKQTEIYLMKKFIHIYKVMDSNGIGTKSDCYLKMNECLTLNGYAPKKSVTTVLQWWDVPFISYEWPYHDESNY
jgi:hypothetical protein